MVEGAFHELATRISKTSSKRLFIQDTGEKDAGGD
jgi:hypothetical protein